jgi:hypothetical protein
MPLPSRMPEDDLMGIVRSAERLVEEGVARYDAGDASGAEAKYRAAIAIAPDWSVPHYNIGLVCKYAGRWRESFEYNLRATQLAPDDRGAAWNLGIAATALGHWGAARRAWTLCGIADPGGSDPPQYPSGQAALRLDPAGAGEVVWGVRLDPARARIQNVPLPSSAFRFADIVLNDGALQGERVVDGRKYPVFDVLCRLVPSPMRTFVLELASVDRAAVEALSAIAERTGGSAEHWGVSTRIMCRECSYGAPHVHADEDAATPAHPHCGLAALNADAARRVIDEWLASGQSADLLRWYPAGGDAPDPL